MFLLSFLSCFVAIGSLERYITFGRILNIGFLSIYLCFILVGFRILYEDLFDLKRFFVIDIIMILCIFTQPINIVIISFIYIEKIYNFLLRKIRIRQFTNLFILTVSISTYIIIILSNGLMTQSYAKSGLNESFEFLIKPFFGRMIFNIFFAIIYSNLPSLIPVLLFIFYIISTFRYPLKLHWYSLYVLIFVTLISAIWRPGLLQSLETIVGDNEVYGVYAMPTILVSLFLTVSLLTKFTQQHTHRLSYYGIWSALILLFLINCFYTNYPVRGKTIPIEQSLEKAELTKNGDKWIYKVPINPEGWYMLLPKQYIEASSKKKYQCTNGSKVNYCKN